MWRALMVRAALGGVAICAAGSVAGVSLANYVASGSFEFYKQPRVAEWQPAGATALQTTDLEFARAHGQAIATADRTDLTDFAP